MQAGAATQAVSLRRTPNRGGRSPDVARVDLSVGEVQGGVADPNVDTNPSTRVLHGFTAADWKREGERVRFNFTLENVSKANFVRVRGSNTEELETAAETLAEDPLERSLVLREPDLPASQQVDEMRVYLFAPALLDFTWAMQNQKRENL